VTFAPFDPNLLQLQMQQFSSYGSEIDPECDSGLDCDEGEDRENESLRKDGSAGSHASARQDNCNWDDDLTQTSSKLRSTGAHQQSRQMSSLTHMQTSSAPAKGKEVVFESHSIGEEKAVQQKKKVTGLQIRGGDDGEVLFCD